MAQQTVPLYTVTSGKRVDKARKSLGKALGKKSQLGDPDDAGAFEVSIDAETPDEARTMVNEALAKAGAGDDFVIRETTEGREIPADDPRQAGADGAVTTAPGAGTDAALDRADAALTAAGAPDAPEGTDPATAAAASASPAGAGISSEESGAEAAEAARDFAAAARESATASQQPLWKQFAPIGGLLVLLMFMRRRRRRR